MNKKRTDKSTPEWNSLNWGEIAEKVLNLQCLIYEASKIGSIEKVREYQNSLVNMNEAKYLAIRRVTQDNKGKKTAGIDGVKKLNSKQRMNMVDKIKIDGKTSAIRRVWIPKPGKKEKRPLGIPTIKDRIKQQLVKLALEPQWEAKFEGHSYGFRPGRGTMDAIAQVRHCLQTGERYILDADIRKCFDRIDHDVLIKKINTSHTISKQIYAWLKAGILDPDISLDPIINEKGTPQGGLVSPLLSNIALHGIEERMQSKYTELNKTIKNEKKHRRESLKFIRYADDFVVIHPSYQMISKMKGVISDFLSEIGLELNEEKTKIRNSLISINYNNELIKPGLTYLGVFFRLYEAKSSTTKITVKGKGVKVFKKLRAIPSNEGYLSHMNELWLILKESRGLPQSIVINKLAKCINGWTLFYRFVHSSKVFNNCDYRLFNLLKRWCYWRHRNMTKKKALQKYFMQHKGRKWTFGLLKHGIYPKVLPFHSHRNGESYTKVKESFTPFSHDHIIDEKNFKLNKTAIFLFKRQRGICKWCLYRFYTDQGLEVHHTLPQGHIQWENMTFKWLIHRHCHDELHAFYNFEFYEGHKGSKFEIIDDEEKNKKKKGKKK